MQAVFLLLNVLLLKPSFNLQVKPAVSCPYPCLCDMLLGRRSKNSLNSQSVCRHQNSQSQFLSFSRSTLEHRETGLNIKHNVSGDLSATSNVDKC
ncbi:hypothetical protein QUB69_29715 [Microcoleus sp. AT13-A6]